MPETVGCIACDTSPPTAISLNPSFAAFSRSTITAMYGCVSDRLLVASAVTSRSCTALSTSSAAVVSWVCVFAVMFTSMSEEENAEP